MSLISSNDFGNGLVAAFVDHDPSTTPTDVPKGYMIVDSTGTWWRKIDDGLTSNVECISISGSPRNFFAPVGEGTQGLSTVGKHVVGIVSSSNFAYFSFRFPDDFGSLTAASVVIIEFGSGSNITIEVDYGKKDEARTTHVASTTVAIPSGSSIIRELDVTSLFANATAGDYVGGKVSSSFIDYFHGIYIKYLAA